MAQKIGEITVTLAIPQVDKANLMLGDLITVEFGEPVKLIAYCGNLLLSWASL